MDAIGEIEKASVLINESLRKNTESRLESDFDDFKDALGEISPD